MIKKSFTFMLAFVLLSVMAFAQMVSPQAQLELDSSVVYGKLDNGLTYYIKHNEKPAQRADFYIVTNVGAIQETPAQDGLAHFFEHMCFNGTKNFPGKGIISYMESIGAKFGENVNAATSVEMTSYMLNNIPVIREGIIDSSLLILHDWSAFVTNDPQEIENERGVILEEKRTRNTAQWRARTAACEALFNGTKYATCSIIGSEENLKTFKPEELVNFYKTWYRPDMQAIIVVGDVDVKSVENKIKNLFGQLPKAENPKAKDVILIPDNKEPIVSIFTDKEHTSTSAEVYFKSQPLPKEYRGLGMAVIMNLYKNMISRMFSERFSDISSKPDAPFFGAGAGFGKLCSTLEAFYGNVQSKDGEAVKALKAMFVELERARRFGFTQSEFDRAKTNLLRGYERAAANAASMQNGQFVQSYISHFLEGHPYTTPDYNYQMIKGYLEGGAIQLPMLNQMMSQLLTEHNMVVIFNAPEKEGLATPAKEDLLDAIAAAKAEDIKPLEGDDVTVQLMDASTLTGSEVKLEEEGKFGTTKLVLGNGIEIYVKPTDFKKDEVSLKTVALGGKSIIDDSLMPSLEGNIASIIQSYSGLGEFSATKLRKMLTGKAAGASAYIGGLEHGVNGTCSPRDFETMLQLVYMCYTQPRFDESEISVGMNQLKAMLPNVINQPSFIFQNEVTKTLYGESPRIPNISAELLEKASVADYAKIYNQLFSDAAKTKVYIVGNVNIDEIKPLLEKYIGSLPVKTENGAMWKDHNISIVEGNVENVFEVAMEAPKATVALVYSGDMKYSIENSIVMSALKYVLDMTYTKTIREDEGGTYGVGVSASLSDRPRDEFSLMINFDTDPAKAEKLISIAKDGLADIVKNGVAQEYVSKAKESFLKSFPERQISNGYWMSVIYNYYGLDKDINSEYVETVEKCVTSKNIQKLLKKMIKQGNMVKIVMNPKQ
ncbi:MAG: insulinase family protein [Bacteroidales bacterium]|nr:insulinase family protein [Bacteroidales bacterium]